MTSEPQVTSSTATQNSSERILTRRQADLLPVYDVVGRWLHRNPAFLHETHHLEELALMTVAAEWLTRWQPISMYRALLAGTTPEQVAEAARTSVQGMYEQWKQRAVRGVGQAGCAYFWIDQAGMRVNCDPGRYPRCWPRSPQAQAEATANVPSPASRTPSPSSMGRYPATSRSFWIGTPQKSETALNLRAGATISG